MSCKDALGIVSLYLINIFCLWSIEVRQGLLKSVVREREINAQSERVLRHRASILTICLRYMCQCNHGGFPLRAPYPLAFC
jgi:hypothetical protein